MIKWTTTHHIWQYTGRDHLPRNVKVIKNVSLVCFGLLRLYLVRNIQEQVTLTCIFCLCSVSIWRFIWYSANCPWNFVTIWPYFSRSWRHIKVNMNKDWTTEWLWSKKLVQMIPTGNREPKATRKGRWELSYLESSLSRVLFAFWPRFVNG